MKQLVRRFRAGDIEAARELDRELAPSIELLRVAPNPIAIKCALNLLGHEVGGLRLPLVEADEDERPPDPRTAWSGSGCSSLSRSRARRRGSP